MNDATTPDQTAGLRAAAVLVLFAGEGLGGTFDDVSVLLLQRASDLRDHPGQVAFPGGRLEGDENATDAALREAAEETGVDVSQIEVLAELPARQMAVSRHVVTPVLARCAQPLPVRAVDAGETEAAFWVPVAELVNPSSRFTAVYRRGGIDFAAPAWQVTVDGTERLIWGFTAGILSDLLDEFGWSQPWNAAHRREIP